MSNKANRYHSPDTKISILKQHLLEGKPISDVCDEHKINPNLFYRWQKELFEKGACIFEKQSKRSEEAEQRRYAELEDRIKQKDSVIAEIMVDLIKEKKRHGGH